MRIAGRLDGDTFRLWFHWPVAHHPSERKLDDYHQPKESLTGFESEVD